MPGALPGLWGAPRSTRCRFTCPRLCGRHGDVPPSLPGTGPRRTAPECDSLGPPRPGRWRALTEISPASGEHLWVPHSSLPGGLAGQPHLTCARGRRGSIRRKTTEREGCPGPQPSQPVPQAGRASERAGRRGRGLAPSSGPTVRSEPPYRPRHPPLPSRTEARPSAPPPPAPGRPSLRNGGRRGRPRSSTAYRRGSCVSEGCGHSRGGHGRIPPASGKRPSRPVRGQGCGQRLLLSAEPGARRLGPRPGDGEDASGGTRSPRL